MSYMTHWGSGVWKKMTQPMAKAKSQPTTKATAMAMAGTFNELGTEFRQFHQTAVNNLLHLATTPALYLGAASLLLHFSSPAVLGLCAVLKGLLIDSRPSCCACFLCPAASALCRRCLVPCLAALARCFGPRVGGRIGPATVAVCCLGALCPFLSGSGCRPLCGPGTHLSVRLPRRIGSLFHGLLLETHPSYRVYASPGLGLCSLQVKHAVRDALLVLRARSPIQGYPRLQSRSGRSQGNLALHLLASFTSLSRTLNRTSLLWTSNPTSRPTFGSPSFRNTWQSPFPGSLILQRSSTPLMNSTRPPCTRLTWSWI